ncbi:MAG: CTP synthase, partial [Candidatus Bathyarchaeum sp.]
GKETAISPSPARATDLKPSEAADQAIRGNSETKEVIPEKNVREEEKKMSPPVHSTGTKKKRSGEAEIASLLYRARAFEMKKDYRQALENYKAVLARDKENFTVMNNIAYILLQLGNAEESLKYAGNALAIKNTYVPALVNLGIAQAKSDQRDAAEMIDEETLRKVALFGTIPKEAVFCSYDVPSIYQVPLILDKQGMGDYTCKRLGISKNAPEWNEWKQFVECFENPKHTVKIALIGKYAGLVDSYVSMNEAFKHAGAACQTTVEVDYLEAEDLENNTNCAKLLEGHDGVFIPYGFGPRGTEGKIKGVQFARENNIPFLGVCYGFQLAVVEFARNVCGFEGANSTEINPKTPHPVIDLMPEQRTVNNKGGTMRLGAHEVRVHKDTIAYTLYGVEQIFERHRHRWEVNPDYWSALEKNGLIFSGNSPDGRRKEILEYPSNFFFFASQFHGEFKSRPTKPEPEYYGFIKACLDKKLGKTKPEF